MLAHAYTERDDGRVDIHLYDPNFPLRDDVYLRCEPVTLATQREAESVTLKGFRTIQRVGDRDVRPVRGFFAVPYVPVHPPAL